MNSSIKEQLIAALKSGEYAQTKSSLRTTKGYCCLGVLCDLYAKHANIPWEERAIASHEIRYLGQDSELPPAVQIWSGLDHFGTLPVYIEGNDNDHHDTLAELNDTGSTFDEIADIIEAHL